MHKCNLDDDCDTIARLLLPYCEMMHESLGQGDYVGVVTILLEVFESLAYHFVEDEHYDYFDDMYSPDYVCINLMNAIIEAVKIGHFPDVELRRLKRRGWRN